MAETKEGAPQAPVIIAGIYALPMQITLNARGQQRIAKMFVRLVKGNGIITDKGWQIEDEEGVPIVEEYLTGARPLPSGVIAALWSETGQKGGKMLISAPTYVRTGKNLGRANATNVLSQAISEAKSRWENNARKRGAVTDLNELSQVQNDRPKPMALHSFPPQAIDGKFDITGTSYWKEGRRMFMSLKADGNRLVARVNRDSAGEPHVEMWGRAGDAPPNPLAKISRQLLEIGRANLAALPITFDGEVYFHGMKHQLINGIVMNENADADALEYWVFDIMMAGEFEARYKYLCELLSRTPQSNIKLIPEHPVSTSTEIERLYKEFLRSGYEGAVLRTPDGPYETGTRKEVRSANVLKLKPEYDSEFEIVGYKDGKGNDAGALIWILKMPDDDRTFSVRPKGTIDQRRVMFGEMPSRFTRDFRGKMLRVFYGDTTADGVPRFPRADEIRETL